MKKFFQFLARLFGGKKAVKPSAPEVKVAKAPVAEAKPVEAAPVVHTEEQPKAE